MKPFFLLVVLVTGLLMPQSLAQMTPNGITVLGVGNAYGTPDVAIIDLAIDVYNEDVNVASEEVNQISQRLFELLAQSGIASKDIRTAYYNVWRETRYSPDGQESTPIFHVVNSLSITVREVSQVGELMNASLAAGANAINGIQYTIANPEKLEREARSLAMHNAKARAAELAILSEVSLGKVLSINEMSYGASPMPAGPMMESTSSSPSIGQLAVSISLTVTFEIQDQ